MKPRSISGTYPALHHASARPLTSAKPIALADSLSTSHVRPGSGMRSVERGEGCEPFMEEQCAIDSTDSRGGDCVQHIFTHPGVAKCPLYRPVTPAQSKAYRFLRAQPVPLRPLAIARRTGVSLNYIQEWMREFRATRLASGVLLLEGTTEGSYWFDSVRKARTA